MFVYEIVQVNVKKGSSFRTIKCVCREIYKEIYNLTHRNMCFRSLRDRMGDI